MPGMTRLALAAAGTMAAVLAALLSARRIRRARAMTMIEHDYRRHGRLPLPPAHPAEVGLSAHRLEHISTWADGWVASGKVPGMITAIVRRGKLVYLHVCGCADVERDRPFQTNTVLRAYSMTKCVTSVVAMILYERGLFQLDEPISHFLPAFANPRVLLEDGTLVAADREITVKDLLTHTAGLGYGDGEGEIDELYAGARIGWNTPLDMSLAEFVDRLGRIPLGSHPGERWRYSYATDVLGRLLEVTHTHIPSSPITRDRPGAGERGVPAWSARGKPGTRPSTQMSFQREPQSPFLSAPPLPHGTAKAQLPKYSFPSLLRCCLACP